MLKIVDTDVVGDSWSWFYEAYNVARYRKIRMTNIPVGKSVSNVARVN